MTRRQVEIGCNNELIEEIEQLRLRLGFVEETLRAISGNEVDAIIMTSPQGDKVFSFEEAERPYRVLIEQMSEGAVCLDQNGAILYSNRFFERLIGVDSRELLGKPFIEVVASEDIESWKRLQDREILGGGKVALMGRHGESIPCRICLSRLELRGSIDTGLIITDLRERLVAEKLLRDKVEEAEAANRMKDEFLATVSHELRTPLNVIAGNAKLLTREDPRSEEFKMSIDAILRNVQVHTHIVDSILDISDFSSGRLKLTRQAVELNSLLEEVSTLYRSLAKAKGVAYVLRSSGTPLGVDGDRDRLRQIFSNLLSNALEFTPTGGRIEIKVAKKGRIAEVCVRDTGEGISQSFLPNVFDRFSQEEPTSTRRHNGLGLGLSLVRMLVEAHGGSVAATSEGKGKGASFVVRLPTIELFRGASVDRA